MNRKKCPCCGYFTIDSDDEFVVDICAVCFWQYDAPAHKHPDVSIGANHISLKQAQENFRQHGVCKPEFKNKTRAPLEEELPENN